MVASMPWALMVLSVGRVLAGDSPCPDDSLPEHECDFDVKDGVTTSDKCWWNVNTGQAATSGGPCQVPSPDNGCMLEQKWGGLKWNAQNKQGVTCCNCFLKKPYAEVCPVGSTAGYECQKDWDSCYKAVNMGAAAQPNPDCIVPGSPHANCELSVDKSTGVWEWKISSSGFEDLFGMGGSSKPCCNCYKAKDDGWFSWSQVAARRAAATAATKEHTKKQRRLRAAARSGDEASMLQLPFDLEDEEFEDEEEL